MLKLGLWILKRIASIAMAAADEPKGEVVPKPVVVRVCSHAHLEQYDGLRSLVSFSHPVP